MEAGDRRQSRAHDLMQQTLAAPSKRDDGYAPKMLDALWLGSREKLEPGFELDDVLLALEASLLLGEPVDLAL